MLMSRYFKVRPLRLCLLTLPFKFKCISCFTPKFATSAASLVGYNGLFIHVFVCLFYILFVMFWIVAKMQCEK